MKPIDVLIIGGGSAGMAAGLAAKEQGIENLLILERAPYLGGILRQCIHNGFGLHRFDEELTGVEYAQRYADMVAELNIPYKTDTFVLEIRPDRTVTTVSEKGGLETFSAKAIVLATGCRERPRGALLIPGTRPAGVFTAGTAQKYLNLEGFLPGKRAVILGSGDIGLIMARQFTLEGIKVEEVVEIMPYSSGLSRNISQCLNDFGIPISFSSTVVEIKGRSRVEGVTVAKVDERRKPIPGTEREIACDTLLISAGLIPENELAKGAGVALSPATRGAAVDDAFHTSVPGIFSCGNALHVNDLVDNVSQEGAQAGKNAALYALGGLHSPGRADCVTVLDGAGVSGVVPQFIRKTGEEEKIGLMFRPRNVFKNHSVCAYAGDACVFRKKAFFLAPGELCRVQIDRKLLAGAGETITVRIEE